MKATRTVQGTGFSSERKALTAVAQEARRKHIEQGFKKIHITKTFAKQEKNGSWAASATVEGER